MGVGERCCSFLGNSRCWTCRALAWNPVRGGTLYGEEIPEIGVFPIYRICNRICIWWSCERGWWLKKDKFFCRDVVFSYSTRTGGSRRFMHRAAQGNELRRSDSYLCCERWSSVVATSPGNTTGTTYSVQRSNWAGHTGSGPGTPLGD